MRICKAYVINLQKVYLREDSFFEGKTKEEKEGGWALIVILFFIFL